jgi:two-component system vancomycin resistance associated response regulator VraR
MVAAPEYGYITGAKESGADSFWYQQPDEDELIQLMNRTMEGESIYPPQMIAHLGDALSSDFTDREIQVLREVVAGRTDAEIADKLGISLRTVKGHIQNLREKTGYRNRTELAVHARSSGLIIQ